MNREAKPMQYVVSPDHIDGDAVERVGGKAAGLAELERLGARVPDWFALPTSTCANLLERTGTADRLADSLEALDPDDADQSSEPADIARREIRGLDLPDDLLEELRTARQVYIGDGPLAVRSSGAAEDSSSDSFAGMYESLLFVESFEELVDALREVWASAFAPRALAYRLRRDCSPTAPRIGVVVQRMVEPAVSGVAFTANPTNGDVEQVVVDALWGAGEGLVAEGLEADHWVVDKISGEIDRRIASKETKFDDAPDAAEVTEQPVAAADRDRPCLDDDAIRRIVSTCRELEEHVERPQDVEFVRDPDGQLFFLQTRPVTTVDRRGPAAGRRRTWDNSNIVESYAGTTTPLTFTFIQHVYATVYRRFGELLGVSADRMREFGAELDHKLGLIRGRVYYNLDNWYETMALLPGWRLHAETLESMLGVDEAADRTPDPPAADGLLDRLGDVGASLRVLLQTCWRFARIRRLVENFEADFEQSYRAWRAADFGAMSLRELMEAYEEMERDFLEDWGVPILNHYYVMLAHGIFERLCEEWFEADGARLANDLLCGEGGIATKQASMELLDLAALADRHPAVRTMILEGDLEAVHAEVLDRPADDAFRAGVEAYLETYGARTMDELKLEEPTLRERPERLYRLLRNYLQSDDASVRDPEIRREREHAIRREAEETAFEALDPARRMVFRKVLEAARFGVRNRENMRFARTRIYGLVRQLFVEVGERFAERDILEAPEDIFYLGHDEIWDYIRGAAITTRLDALVELRRREFAAYDADGPEEAPDDRFFTYGTVYESAPFAGRPTSGASEADGDWQGTGCSSGVVEGEAKVVTSADDDLSVAGEILVAEQTDPGWVPLFASASALVVERGSPLSHAAIVAREMGLPAVVGVEGATEVIDTGDDLRIDGEAGTVELLSNCCRTANNG